jgi:hypothetical protein
MQKRSDRGVVLEPAQPNIECVARQQLIWAQIKVLRNDTPKYRIKKRHDFETWGYSRCLNGLIAEGAAA